MLPPLHLDPHLVSEEGEYAEGVVVSPIISCTNVVPGIATELVPIKKVGRGANSDVYLTVHMRTLQCVALKCIPCRHRFDIETVRNELKTLSSQRWPLLDPEFKSSEEECPHIVRLYGSVVLKPSTVAIGVEYMDVGSLQSWIEGVEPAPEPWIASIAYQILKAMQSLNSHGISHRDIKPGNVLLVRTGDAKLADFGCSSSIIGDGISLGDSWRSGGTWRYMAPERLNMEAYHANSDIWSFGMTLAAAALGGCPVVQAPTEFGQLQEAEEAWACVLKSGTAVSLHPTLMDFLGRCIKFKPDERAGLDELLAHPFLAMRIGWEDACPGVLNHINKRVPKVPLEWVVNEIVSARVSRGIENMPIQPESFRSLAFAFGTTSEAVSEQFTRAISTEGTSVRAHFPRHELDSSMYSLLEALKSTASGAWSDARNISYLAHRMQKGVGTKDRVHRLRFYKQCFVGSRAVQWLVDSGVAASEAEALVIGNEMMKAGIFHHIRSEHTFENASYYYQFSADFTNAPSSATQSPSWEGAKKLGVSGGAGSSRRIGQLNSPMPKGNSTPRSRMNMNGSSKLSRSEEIVIMRPADASKSGMSQGGGSLFDLSSLLKPTEGYRSSSLKLGKLESETSASSLKGPATLNLSHHSSDSTFPNSLQTSSWSRQISREESNY